VISDGGLTLYCLLLYGTTQLYEKNRSCLNSPLDVSLHAKRKKKLKNDSPLLPDEEENPPSVFDCF